MLLVVSGGQALPGPGLNPFAISMVPPHSSACVFMRKACPNEKWSRGATQLLVHMTLFWGIPSRSPVCPPALPGRSPKA